MISYIFVVLGIICTSGAQLLLKKSSSFDSTDIKYYLFLGIAMLFYVVSFVLYSKTLKSFNLNWVSPVMTISTMIVVITLSFFIFKETLTTKQIVGLSIGLLSIILITT